MYKIISSWKKEEVASEINELLKNYHVKPIGGLQTTAPPDGWEGMVIYSQAVFYSENELTGSFDY